MSVLREDIEDLQRRYEEGLTAEAVGADERALLDKFLTALEAGEIRAAEKEDGEWTANGWVKQGILLNFGLRRSRRTRTAASTTTTSSRSGRPTTSRNAVPGTRRTVPSSAGGPTSAATRS